MKTYNRNFMAVINSLVVAIILTFSSCKKGDSGPAGPAGINGTNGTNGITIISSTLSVSTWTWNNGNKWREVQLTNLSLTQNVIDKGSIMIYEDLGGIFTPLPSSLSYPGNPTFLTSFYFSTNFLTIYYSASDFNDYGNMTKTFKIVIIPPAIRKPNVDYSDYDEAKDAYNIFE